MSNFENCISWVLQLEDRGLTGRVTTLPGDRGGKTRFGIAQNENPGLAADFYTLPSPIALAMSKNIYLARYWRPCGAGDFQTDVLAATHLAFAVNAGVTKSVKILQCVLGDRPDGVYGPATLAAVMRISDEAVAAGVLRTAQKAFYQSLGGPYLAGWLQRVGVVYPNLP